LLQLNKRRYCIADMVEDEDPMREDPHRGGLVTVTPTVGDTLTGQQNDATPQVSLGVRHVDHSDNERSHHEPAPDPATNTVDEQFDDAEDDPSSRPFPETKFTIDESTNYGTSHVPITNVTLPLSKLIKLMHGAFKCRYCLSIAGKIFTVERYGVAISLYFECRNCSAAGSPNVHACRANLTTELEAKWALKAASKPFKDSKKDTVNAVDFQLNRKLYLATQQCGGGFTEAKVMAGMLGLHNNPLRGRWKEIGNEIGQEIIGLGLDVIEENVLIEMELSPEDEKGKALSYIRG
jgi:hypothetical protein